MRQQQNDPIAQAMQILQLVTQRRGQQADIQQSGRRLDLQEQQLKQNDQQFNQGLRWDQEQFNQGLQWDQEQFDKRSQQWEAEQAQRQVQQALENAARERQLGTTINYQDAIAEKLRQEISGKIQDPQMMAVKQAQVEQLVSHIQNQILNARNPVEAARLNDQLQSVMQSAYKDMLPPLREYTPQEQQMMQMFQTK